VRPNISLARIIQENLGGTMVSLELEKSYPEDYRETVDQLVKENEISYLPPLKTKIDHIEQYDVMFLGFPTWDMQLPPPMKSLLRQYTFKGKTVIPFNTNAGYGEGNSFTTVKDLCPQSTVLEGFGNGRRYRTRRSISCNQRGLGKASSNRIEELAQKEKISRN
jgi:flavodoxin